MLAAFPGENGKVAFESTRDGDREIFVMNPDGSEQVQVTDNAVGDVQPNWSPDGTEIAFVSESEGVGDIYVMNADGSGRTNVTNDPGENVQPHWSPDGSQIVFERFNEIYAMNADGTEQTVIASDPVGNSLPAWSPDGSKISFRHCFVGTDCDVWAMNPDGTEKTRLTFFGHPVNGKADWSPDGAQIAFTTGSPGLSDVWTMNAGGSAQINVTNSGGLANGTPAWSPDGSKITFSRHAGGDDIYVIDADGSEEVRLTFDPAIDGEPDWQPLPPTPAYDFDGFHRPVDNLPAVNAIKAGRAVPVKFSLGGEQGLDVFAPGYPKSEEVECGSEAAVDGSEETLSAGGSTLSYDPLADTYTYVWKTVKGWAGSCRQLVLKLDDDTLHKATFSFK